MNAYREMRDEYYTEYQSRPMVLYGGATFEEWLSSALFNARLEASVYKQFAEDSEPVYLAFQPPVTRVLVRFVVDTVDWVREAGFKVRGRLGLYKPPF